MELFVARPPRPTSYFFRGFAKGVSRPVSPVFFSSGNAKRKKKSEPENNSKKGEKTEENGKNWKRHRSGDPFCEIPNLGVQEKGSFLRRRETNKHKQLFGIVPEMGGGQFCLCVAFFLRGKGNHINKIPRKSQENAGTVLGQSRDNCVKILFMCFLVYWFLLALIFVVLQPGIRPEKCRLLARE